MHYTKISTISIKAFSLIELSIVLTIIGLLVAGISSGSAFIYNAKLRSVMSDVEHYQTALTTFADSYGELPGDMKDSSALKFFGVTNKVRNSYNPANDGFIGGAHEAAMAFWHMSLAELIFGEYNGVYSGTVEVPGINVGKAKFSKNSGFHFFTLGVTSNAWGYGSSSVYLKTHKNVLTFSKTRSDGYVLGDSALTPLQAYDIDIKKDDGLPHAGSVMADHGVDVGNNNQCINYAKSATSYIASDSPLEYRRIEDHNKKCRMMFEMTR